MIPARRHAPWTAVVACWVGSTALAATVDFEGIPLGTLYGSEAPNAPGAVVLTQQGIDMSVEPFLLGDFQDFYRAEISERYQELFDSTPLGLDNISVLFHFARVGFEVNRVTLDYVELGGGVNFAVNGLVPSQLVSLADIPEDVAPGVSVTVGSGTVVVSGDIDSLLIGGQELAIDNIVAIPEPSTIALLGFGGFLAIWRTQRRR